MSDPFSAASSAFNVMFAIVVIFIAVVFVLMIVTMVRNYSKAKSTGHDPLTLQTELATRALDSEILAPAKSIEQRLAELDDLAARGVISADERLAARADVLAGR
ncbi:SHOCT domain-containing protein [Agromyces sp. SYSU K20354]|uniref:SHOCT domain-containing protein n=1 Tax=Agromyces cavernae TaxID=2898659 RepID=UPI001E4D7D46|nr:SHOCT domain-containing protein [Agromyces cavernae]MCD2441527.1 SHOCT domain-containing protein [Agromyces cavernae]